MDNSVNDHLASKNAGFASELNSDLVDGRCMRPEVVLRSEVSYTDIMSVVLASSCHQLSVENDVLLRRRPRLSTWISCFCCPARSLRFISLCFINVDYRCCVPMTSLLSDYGTGLTRGLLFSRQSRRSLLHFLLPRL